MINQVVPGDCLEVMARIARKTVRLILCELPYGNTANPWDSVINLVELWQHY